MSNFAERLKAARQYAGLTQKQLADRSGVPQPNISRIERGGQDSSAHLVGLATACGVRPEWLASGQEPMVAEGGNIASAPRAVRAFEDSDPLDVDEVEVPRLTLKLSGGSGRLQWEIDQHGASNRFRKSWCAKKGLRPERLVTVLIEGDSMSPTIPDGASVTVNTADTTLRNGRLHAIDYLGEFFIKRLLRQPDGSLLVRSDNPDKTRYPDWPISPEHADALRVLGAPVSVSADLD